MPLQFMKSRNHLLLLLALVSSLLVALMLSTDLQVLLFRNPQIDTIGHFIGFFFLCWLLHSGFKLPLIPLSASLCIYAGLTELGQWYLGFRNAEFTDFFADIAGIISFVLCRWLLLMFRHSKSL